MYFETIAGDGGRPVPWGRGVARRCRRVPRGGAWCRRADAEHGAQVRERRSAPFDRIDRFDSVVTVLLATYDSTGIPTRVRIQPTEGKGINKVVWAMADKIVTVKRSTLGTLVCRVDDETMREIGRRLALVLGF